MELEFENFISDLTIIQESMYKAIGQSDYPDDTHLFEALDKFHENINTFQLYSKSNKSETTNKYLNKIASSEIEPSFAKLYALLKSKTYTEIRNTLGTADMKLFSTIAELSIELKAIIKDLLKEYKKDQQKHEAFTPDGINKDELLKYLDNAIEDIETNESIADHVKNHILIIINESKSEIKKETPRWRRVLGDLAFVATIIGGIAVAPQAFENVSDAFKYIIEKPLTTTTTSTTKEYINSEKFILLESKANTGVSTV